MSEQHAKTRPIQAQSAGIARAMASICNDERVRFGVVSGHDRKTLSLSVGIAAMLSPPARRPPGPMLFAVLGQGLSTGMGFAALGLALYAHGPAAAAAALFGAVGLLCGAAAASLRLLLDGVPAALPVPLPAEALATLLRAMLAQAQQERHVARSGSAADRCPDSGAEPLPGPARDVAPPVLALQPALAGARTLPAHSAVVKHRRAGSAVESWRARIA